MKSVRPLYFGYGSNMWQDQMASRCPQSKFLGIAYLADWKWIINERRVATIMQSPGDIVYALVYHISESDEESLDGWEHVADGLYVKEYHPVVFLGKGLPVGIETKMLIYVDKITKEGTAKPSYVDRMRLAIADAEREGVPESYIEEYLRAFILKK